MVTLSARPLKKLPRFFKPTNINFSLTCIHFFSNTPGKQDRFAVTNVAVLSTATAVCWLHGGGGPAAPTPVRRLREGLRRVLPGPGPLLCLGRRLLLPLLPRCQEVGTLESDAVFAVYRTWFQL